MLAELHQYYENNGISARDFFCPFFNSCSRLSPDTFTTAKEAFVSSGYIKHEIPRVLFLSLDSGSADTNPLHKTIEYVSQYQEFEEDVLNLPRNKHWFRTHELAWHILRNFKPNLSISEVKGYFAHTNSAKCCMNNPGRAQANYILFENCRRFIPGEIQILSPDILITQGEYAHRVVEEEFPQIDKMEILEVGGSVPEEFNFVIINSTIVIWIKTFHPRNPNSKVNRDNYDKYEEFIIRYFGKSSIYDRSVKLQPDELKGGQKMRGNSHSWQNEDYIYLNYIPPTPSQNIPTKEESLPYEYMTMVQLCNIAESHGMTRSKACNAFGGDGGKYKVEPSRMARVAMIGNKKRKYVLVQGVIDFFKQERVDW